MANLLQSSQTKATTTPQFYSDYLSNLATAGKAAADAAQYAGEQPLQTEAFSQVCQNFGKYAPDITTAAGYVGCAAKADITGAVSDYLSDATGSSPLTAAQTMICCAKGFDIGCVASKYMSPYITDAIQSMSDIAQRNIRQNLSPEATAAAVGSGQFGSQRGAQVLGQVQAQAQQDLNSQIANLLNAGYGQALGAAQAKQGTLTSLAQQIASAQAAQNQAQLQAGQIAGCAAAKQAGALTAAGQAAGNLAQTGAAMNLACINALATLGAQQQTIKQNEQNYPLTKLASLSALMQGQTIPTTTKTTLCMSPLSGLGAIGAGALGLYKCVPGVKSLVDKVFSGIGGGGGGGGTTCGVGCGTGGDNSCDPCVDYSDGCTGWFPCCEDTSFDYCCGSFCIAKGGSVKASTGKVGCYSTRSYGALPTKGGR